MKFVLMLVSLMLLAGCVSAGVKVDEANLAAFQKGKTTYSDVVARLGQPTGNTVLSDGRRMLIYSWVQASARPESFIPIVGPFVGRADSRSSNVIIWINADGILDSYSTSQSQIGVGQGLAAGSNPGPVANQPRADGH